MKKEWFVIEQHFDAQLYPYHLYMDVLVNDFQEGAGANLRDVCLFYENGNFKQIFEKNDFGYLAKKAAEKLQNFEHAKKVAANSRKGINGLFNIAHKIRKTNIARATNEEIAKLIEEFTKAFAFAGKWGVVFPAAEHEHNLVSKKIKKIICEKIEKQKLNLDANDVFAAFIHWPEYTHINQEKEGLLKIAALPLEKSEKELEKHVEKYKWITFGFQGPELDQEYFKKELGDLKNREETLEKMQREEKNALKKRDEYFEQLKFTEQEKQEVLVLVELNFLKAYRKDAEFHGNYAFSFIFKELAKRFQIPLTQARLLLSNEMLTALREGKIDAEELQKRVNKVAYVYLDGKLSTPAGEEAEKYRYLVPKEEISEVNELKGDIACKGKATGIVKVVLGKSGYAKFNEGDVLVSIATNPNMVPLMKKSCAIITDIGGITCHAAIVSRELGKPCIIGTKIATKALKDGDKVEVDADKGIVRKLS